MRYNDLWHIDDDDHEKIISRYVILEFKAKPGCRYKISVDAPEDRESARELGAQFNAVIIDARTGEKVPGSVDA